MLITLATPLRPTGHSPANTKQITNSVRLLLGLLLHQLLVRLGLLYLGLYKWSYDKHSCQSHIEIIYQIYIISKNRSSFLKKKKSMIGFEHGTLALQACLLRGNVLYVWTERRLRVAGYFFYILIRTCNAFVFQLVIKCYIFSDISEDMQITRLVTQE